MMASKKSATPPEFLTSKQGILYWSDIEMDVKTDRLPPTIKFRTGTRLVLKSSRRSDLLPSEKKPWPANAQSLARMGD